MGMAYATVRLIPVSRMPTVWRVNGSINLDHLPFDLGSG